MTSVVTTNETKYYVHVIFWK